MANFQSDGFLYAFPMSHCLILSKRDEDEVRKCYYRFFPVARKVCGDELEELIDWCGRDNRGHPECHRVWKKVQRCMKYQGYWPDILPHPPRKDSWF